MMVAAPWMFELTRFDALHESNCDRQNVSTELCLHEVRETLCHSRSLRLTFDAVFVSESESDT